ncbi:MAG: type I restriction endonuclease [Methylococcaceae bacterium]
MAFLSAAAVEQALLEQLEGLGYSIEREENIDPDGHSPERESHDELVLKKRFEEAVTRLNPGLPEENRRFHKLMMEGKTK